jgi:predicted ATPase
VILLDDFDVADQEARVVVGALIDAAGKKSIKTRKRGIAIVIASRDAPSRGTMHTACRLEPLNKNDAHCFLRSLLKSFTLPEPLLEEAVALSRGLPLHIRQIALALRREWGESRRIPTTAELPEIIPTGKGLSTRAWKRLDNEDREILEALAVLDRAVSTKDIAAATDLAERRVSQTLRRLSKIEVVSRLRSSRRYELTVDRDTADRLRDLPVKRLRDIHRRMSTVLKKRVETRRSHHAADSEHLAAHLLAAGRRREGCCWALRAADRLRRNRSFDRAISILDRAFGAIRDASVRLRLAEAMSDLLKETGDHDKGISVLEALSADPYLKISDSDRVRLERRLGYH